MMKTRTIIIILLPAIVLSAFGLLVAIIRYQPTRIKTPNPAGEKLNKVLYFAEDTILGSKAAPKTIIAFEDIGCGRCQEQLELFDELLAKHAGQIKIILKTIDATRFPVSSAEAHKYLFCAGKQNKLQEFKKEILISKQLDKNSLQNASLAADLTQETLAACLSSQKTADYVEKNNQLAQSLGIEFLPTIFINDKIIQEPLTLAGWESLLNLNTQNY